MNYRKATIREFPGSGGVSFPTSDTLPVGIAGHRRELDAFGHANTLQQAQVWLRFYTFVNPLVRNHTQTGTTKTGLFQGHFPSLRSVLSFRSGVKSSSRGTFVPEWELTREGQHEGSGDRGTQQFLRSLANPIKEARLHQSCANMAGCVSRN
jgi:hypothetical protein